MNKTPTLVDNVCDGIEQRAIECFFQGLSDLSPNDQDSDPQVGCFSPLQGFNIELQKINCFHILKLHNIGIQGVMVYCSTARA